MTDVPPPNDPAPLPPTPSPVGYGYGAIRKGTNGPAVASLVLGILGCVPLITGILAVLLGIVGLRKTRDPMVGGRGLAIAGLVLGAISIIAWLSIGGIFGYGYVEMKPAGAVARQFLQDLDSGTLAAATAHSTGFTPAQLQTNMQQMHALGKLQSVSFSSFYVNAQAQGGTVLQLSGVATFDTGSRACIFNMVKQQGVYKVAAFSVQ